MTVRLSCKTRKKYFLAKCYLCNKLRVEQNCAKKRLNLYRGCWNLKPYFWNAFLKCFIYYKNRKVNKLILTFTISFRLAKCIPLIQSILRLERPLRQHRQNKIYWGPLIYIMSTALIGYWLSEEGSLFLKLYC